ncbi:hypothetical protein F2Q70_00025754 [Brassica cretica]|uniref:Uncharacterized protein n=1 Tax=Brassica cretica TaxID=69181 RepID=A0A8S9L6R7_BRACR|nr:hypothetical protein F2Q70_00025754 [Brassica cretica]
MLVFVRGIGAVCVYDQPGDEATLVKQMVSDWSKLALPEYHIDLISESSGVALLEPSRSIRRFLRFLHNPWQRDVWTSDAALVGGGSETSGLATQIVWGVGAETFAFDAALEGGGTETDCTSDAAYVYIYPYEEMRDPSHPNSRNSIVGVQKRQKIIFGFRRLKRG